MPAGPAAMHCSLQVHLLRGLKMGFSAHRATRCTDYCEIRHGGPDSVVVRYDTIVCI